MPAALETTYGVDIAIKYKWIYTQCTFSISHELLHAHTMSWFIKYSPQEMFIIIITKSKVRVSLSGSLGCINHLYFFLSVIQAYWPSPQPPRTSLLFSCWPAITRPVMMRSLPPC